ncbi:RICIN domain-containing protein [Pseudomonas sp. NFACC45]|uniref:RICIN domain-containing protein n=1 Tax=Pseudomonas sp. NFACC45 TaxID=1566201 RepID=UPI0008EA439C|nr:RICIN domain-containing protein [Pseudomonas sp. NFACC45]SFH22981.1 Ricin-type beta-trefoil lectin domain-like [Pseudomonas sp. NFACC45]
MKSKSIPHVDKTPEQTKGAPGPSIIIQPGIYKIYSFLSNYKIVDMALKEDSKGRHEVKLYDDSAEPESTWHIKYSGNGEHWIANGRYQTRVVEAYEGNVITSPLHGSMGPEFYWIFKDAGSGGFFYIQNKRYGTVMDVRGAQTANNTNIIDYAYGGAENQRFRLWRIGDSPG